MPAYEIPVQARKILESMVSSGGQEIEDAYQTTKQSLASDCAKVMRKNGMLASVEIFNKVETSGKPPGAPEEDFRRALLARFALDLPDRIEGMNLPASIIDLYPDLIDRLSKNIAVPATDYDIDAYARDAAHVLGLFLPAVSQDIDLHSHLEFKMFIIAMIKNGQINLLPKYLSNQLWGRCLDIHTDSRNTQFFNQDGWNNCYYCIADLIKSRSDIAGFFGTSWFYDPALVDISPRLAYLQDIPRAGGAFFIWNGPGEVHTQRATLTSRTRRALYEEGKYTPTCYTMVWPRRALLDWAERTSQ